MTPQPPRATSHPKDTNDPGAATLLRRHSRATNNSRATWGHPEATHRPRATHQTEATWETTRSCRATNHPGVTWGHRRPQ